MRNLFTVIVAVASLAVAQAQESPPPVAFGFAERFKSFDRDGDGQVSREEFGDGARFKQYDRNGDGFVTFEEARAVYRAGKDKAANSTSIRRVAEKKTAAVEVRKSLNVRYAEVPGADADLLSLDIYAPSNAAQCPVMVYVHGGGWARGDKQAVGIKPDYFCSRGWVFVSVNYRLVPEVDIFTQLQDSANAIAWVHSHVAEHGGDPSRIFLSGHSAGAHHVAILGTNERFLKAAGKDLSIVKGVVVLDTQALDVPRLMGSEGSPIHGQAFGKDEKVWREVSPLHHVAKDKAIPPCIVFYSHGIGAAREAQIQARKTQAEAFAKALSTAGVRNEVFPAADRSHIEINARFGDPQDNVTQAAMRFLDAPAPPPVGPAPNAFALSYAGGGRDPAGRVMGGTELRNLAAHGSKLYAGVEMWMDRPGSDPASGAQILVLDKTDGPWRLEHEFAEDLPAGRTRRGESTKRFEGVTVLESVTFTTDAQGRPLPKPVAVLLAACRDFLGEAGVFARDDDTGRWIAMRLAANAPRASIRCLGVHRDRVTGVDRVFAGSVPSGIFSGVYDPAAPGKIRWDAKPELANSTLDGRPSRPMAFADCNGELHLLMEPSVYNRTDDPAPTWRAVYTYPAPDNAGSSGLRGLTPVPNPNGHGESLLAAMEGGPSQIVRLDPGEPYRATVELDVREFLNRAWGTAPRYFIVANNHMTWAANPAVPACRSLLISLQVHPAAKSPDAWYFVRHAPERYELHRVTVPGLSSDRTLCSTRTFAVSPFPADDGRAVFVGGYDADERPSHNTAWVAKAPVDALFATPAASPRAESKLADARTSGPATSAATNLPARLEKGMQSVGATPEQRAKIEALARKHVGNLRGSEFQRELETILTPEQRTKLKVLEAQRPPRS